MNTGHLKQISASVSVKKQRSSDPHITTISSSCNNDHQILNVRQYWQYR